MCLTGVDYFSTLGYQPGIAALAAGALSPAATLVLVVVTLAGALPVYRHVAGESPHGEGSIAMLERLLPWWRGKLFVLALLGFAATDFLITMTQSAADATAHLVENPLSPQLLHGHHVAITLLLLALLCGVFLAGFSEAVGIAVVLVVAYLALNLVVVVVSVEQLFIHPGLVFDWSRLLVSQHPDPLLMVAVALLVFPKLALGLSGFETGVSVMPLIQGDETDTEERPEGRIRDTRKLLTTAAVVRSAFLLAGRRVPVTRPRMRALDGSGELAVPAYELFSDTEVLGRMAMERMLAGLSTRRYRVGLEPVGARTDRAATATSKSAVSRRFVAATETALSELLAADLSSLDVVALMVDGVHFGEHCAVVALGIDIDGVKHPLALVEGSTENATLVTELLVGLRERGLDVSRPILTVLDGSKALRRAVLDVFDHPVIARCQLHKLRNVQDRLPQKLRCVVAKRIRAAYHAQTALDAQAELQTLAGELERSHPGAAASLREGLAETLTVLRLDVPPTLARTLRSTNCVESMIEICRDHSRNVKHWQDETMALRWCAAGMVEAGKQFRRVNGHLHLRALRTALERHVAAENVKANKHNHTSNAA
jgi:transposase-like protein